MAKSRLTQEVITTVLKMHHDGATNAHIGKAAGLTGPQVGRIILCYQLHGEEVLRKYPSLSMPMERHERDIYRIVEFAYCYRIPVWVTCLIFLIPQSAIEKAYSCRHNGGKRLADSLAAVPDTVNSDQLDRLIFKYSKKTADACIKEYQALVREQSMINAADSDDSHVSGANLRARKLPEGLKGFVPTGNKIEDTIAIYNMGGRPVDLTGFLNTNQAEASRTIRFINIHGTEEYRRLHTLSEPCGYSAEFRAAIAEFCLAVGATPSHGALIFKTTDASIKNAIEKRLKINDPSLRLNVASLLPGTNVAEAEKIVNLPAGENFASLIEAYQNGAPPRYPRNRRSSSKYAGTDRFTTCINSDSHDPSNASVVEDAYCRGADGDDSELMKSAHGTDGAEGAKSADGDETASGAAGGAKAAHGDESAAGAAGGAEAAYGDESASGVAGGAEAAHGDESAADAAGGVEAAYGDETAAGVAGGAEAAHGESSDDGVNSSQTYAGTDAAAAAGGMVNLDPASIHCEGAGELPLSQCAPAAKTKGRSDAVASPRPKKKTRTSCTRADDNGQQLVPDVMGKDQAIQSLSGSDAPREPEKLDLAGYLTENFGIEPGIPASCYDVSAPGRKGRPQKIDVLSEGFDQLPLDIQNSQKDRFIKELLTALAAKKNFQS